MRWARARATHCTRQRAPSSPSQIESTGRKTATRHTSTWTFTQQLLPSHLHAAAAAARLRAARTASASLRESVTDSARPSPNSSSVADAAAACESAGQKLGPMGPARTPSSAKRQRCSAKRGASVEWEGVRAWGDHSRSAGGKATRLRMQVQNYRALALWTVIDDSNYFDAVNTNVKVFYFRSHD